MRSYSSDFFTGKKSTPALVPFDGITTRRFFCKNRQTTLRSSTFAEGYLFQAVVAASTTFLAAACSLSAAQTMDATWSLLSTSQTYIFIHKQEEEEKEKKVIPIRNTTKSNFSQMEWPCPLPHRLQEGWIGRWNLGGDSRCLGWQWRHGLWVWSLQKLVTWLGPESHHWAATLVGCVALALMHPLGHCISLFFLLHLSHSQWNFFNFMWNWTILCKVNKNNIHTLVWSYK